MSVSPLTENSLHDRKVKDPEDLRCVAVAELPAKGTGVETPGIELENFELSSVPVSRVTTAPLVPDAPVLTDLELKKARRAEMIGFGALLWAMFMEGWNDGTNGPMLPKIESYYNVRSLVQIYVETDFDQFGQVKSCCCITNFCNECCCE